MRRFLLSKCNHLHVKNQIVLISSHYCFVVDVRTCYLFILMPFIRCPIQ